MPVRTKRIYEPPSHGDGYRVLIDGIWPRGITRERAAVDQWARELAPSTQLRQWYGHEPDQFEEFARRYRAELGAQRERLSELRRRSRTGVVTLVFAARDAEHSNATVLGDVLRRGLHRRADRSRGPRSLSFSLSDPALEHLGRAVLAMEQAQVPKDTRGIGGPGARRSPAVP